MEQTERHNLYIDFLNFLFQHTTIYLNSFEDIENLLPHVTSQHINKAYKRIINRKNHSISIALPSIVIYGSYHVVKLTKVLNDKYILEYIKICNTNEIFSRKTLFINDALDIEKNEWKSFYKRNHWNTVVLLEFYAKPIIPHVRNYAFSLAIVYTCDIVKEISSNQLLSNRLQSLDKFIKYIAINPLVINEICYSKQIITEIVCDYCLCKINKTDYCSCFSDENDVQFSKTQHISTELFDFLIKNGSKILKYYPTCNYAIVKINDGFINTLVYAYKLQKITQEQLDEYIFYDNLRYVINNDTNQHPIDSPDQHDVQDIYDVPIPTYQQTSLTNTETNNEINMLLEEIDFDKTINDIYEQFETDDFYDSTNSILTSTQHLL
jgi:hypothetical protein